VARDWRTADLTDADRALCEHAALLTHDQHRNSPAHLDELRKHGFDDRGIHDATQIIGYFNYVTRVADGLGIELEDFVVPWGER
jgi:alkylhydroperoxidase family enzyme